MNAMFALIPPRRPAMPAIKKQVAAIRYITAALRRELTSFSLPGSVFSVLPTDVDADAKSKDPQASGLIRFRFLAGRFLLRGIYSYARC